MHTHKPKFAKELALLSRKEKQKIFLLLKNKTLHTHNPADKSGMREQIDYYNGMSLDKKEGQLVTCGMFYCRNSAEIKVYGSLQTSSRFDSIVLRNRQQKHTAIRYAQIKE
jgi:hypothetical protein